LLLVMADGLLPPDLSYEEVGVDVPLWVDTSFHLLRRWRGDALVGESYRLSNTGAEELEIAEQHLHRPGYLAIGIEQSRLQPGQSTAVHVIRRRTASE
jgi:hypothetical protein